MRLIWTRHLEKLRAQLFGTKKIRHCRKRRSGRKLTLERLEDRTLFTVTPTLDPNGILTISFSAANDQATISVANSQIQISSVTLASGSPSSFAAGSVSGIIATGSNASGQSIAFNNSVKLNGALNVSGLANVTFSSGAAYTAGSASVAAQTIQFNTGAGLFTGTGALTLTATNDTSEVPYFSTSTLGTNASQAGISLNGATLKGGTVKVTVTSTSAENFTDSTATSLLGSNPLSNGVGATLSSQILGSKVPIAGGVAISTADGEITIGSGSSITADNLNLNATASSTASVKTLQTLVGIAYAESDPTAKVVIDSGANITTTGNMTVGSTSDSSLTSEAKKSTLNNFQSSGGAYDLTLAIGESTINSTAQISNGATIKVGGTLAVTADMNKNQFTEASAGAYQNGTLGVGVAVSQSTSNDNAIVGGTVSAGNITITSTSTTLNNVNQPSGTVAESQTGPTVVGKVVGYAANSSLGQKVSGFFQSSQPTPACSSQAATALTLAAAFAYADQTNNATAAIDSSAQVTATNGGISISATTTDAPVIVANSSANASPGSPAPATALSAAVTIGNFANNASAYIGQNATVDATGALSIDSETTVPQNTTWISNLKTLQDLNDNLTSDIGQAASVLDNYANTNAGVAQGFFASWAQSNSSGSNQLGAAGSVNFFTINNASNAYIGKDAQVNQKKTYRSANQTVTVHAGNDVETINLSGVFGVKGFGTSDGKVGIGGAYLDVTYNDTVDAQIEDGASVYASSLAVTAKATTRDISISGSGGSAQTFTLDGTFSQLTVNNQTLAQISGGAIVVTGTALVPNTNSNMLVQATDGGTMIDASGVLATSQAAAIGFSVALNNINRDTEALIGDQGTTNSTPTGSVTAGGAVSVSAANTGLIASGSLAGGVDTSPSPAPPAPPGSPPPPPPPPPPPCVTSTQGTAEEPSGEEVDGAEEEKVADVVGEVTSAEGGASSEEEKSGEESGTEGGKGGSGSNSTQSKGSYGIGISADVSINTVNDTAAAYIHNANIAQAASVSINASNPSQMYAIAGAVTITAGSKQDTDVGLAGSFSDNNINDATSAYVENSTVTASGGAVSLTASNTSYMLAIDASGTGSRSKSGVAVAGSVDLNNINNSTKAYLDSSTIDAASLSQDATDNSSMFVVAGGIDISIGGTAGVGLSFAWNQINNTTAAYATGSTITIGGPINIAATTDATIKAISASLALSNSSKLAVAGAVSINSTANNTNAYISGNTIAGTTSQADGALTVSASDNSTLESLAGDLSITGGSATLGDSFSWNATANTVKAYADNAKVVSSGAVSFKASENADIETLAAGGDGAARFSLAGAVTLNQIDNTVSAYLADGANVTSSGGDVKVTASDSSTIKSLAGALSGAAVSVGASFALNEIGDSITAYVDDSTLSTTAAGSSLDISALGSGIIETISAGAVYSGNGFALGGAVSVNQITNTISAYAADSATVQTNDGNLSLTATDGSEIEALAGQVTGGGAASVGASVAYNDIGNTVSAYVANSTATIGTGSGAAILTISTLSNGTIETIAAGGTDAGSFSLGGSVAVNFIHSTIESYATSATVTNNSTDDSSDIDVSAEGNSTIESLAGTLSGAGTAAVGASVTVNDIGNTITAYVDQSSTVTAEGGNVNFSASSGGTIETLTGTGTDADTFALGGAVSFNHIHDKIQSYIQGGSDVTGQEAVNLSSGDSSEIESLAGDASISGTVAIGAAIAINLIGNTIAAYVDDATAQSKKSNVSLSAQSNATIKSLSGGVSGSGTVAITGAVSYNNIGNTVEAYASNAAQITAAGSISMTAKDTSTIKSLSGQLSIGGDVAGIGGAASYNQISNNIWAYASASTLTTTPNGGNVVLSAASAANIQTIAAGGAFGGIAGVAGSVAINDIGNDVESYLDGATVNANGSVGVLATSNNSTTIYGGALGLAVGFNPVGVGIGGSAAVNILKNTTKAYIDDSSNVTANGNASVTVPAGIDSSSMQNITGVAAIAQSSENVSELVATASFAFEVSGDLGISASAAVAATVVVDLPKDDTEAYVDGSTVTAKNQAVLVNAFSGTNIDTNAGSAAVALSLISVGVGATSDTAVLANKTKAYIDDSSNVTAGSVDVATNSVEEVNSFTVTGAGSLSVSVAGSVLVISVADTNNAYIDDATVKATTGNLDVTAVDAVYLGATPNGSSKLPNGSPVGLLTGGAALGGIAGVGGSVEVSSITNSTLAYVTDSTTNAAGTTAITATSTEDVVPYSASGAAGIGIGASGAVTINTIAVTTQAYASESAARLTQINQDSTYSSSSQNLQIEAKDNPTINDKDGNVSAGALVGAGAAVDVQSVGNTVTAYIGNGVHASAGSSLQVLATSQKNFTSKVAGASGGGLGLQGAVSVINVGSDITSDGTTAANGIGSKVNSQISGSAGGSLGSTPLANSSTSQVNTARGQLSVSSAFNSSAKIAQATTAYIDDNAVITAGSIQVSAKDTTTVQVSAGAKAYGFVGGGAGVGIVTLGDSTNASVGQYANLTATDGDIDVTTKANITNSYVDAGAGAAGLAGLGAAVAELNSTNDASAYIDSDATVNQANNVNVKANTGSNFSANASGDYNGVVGAGAVKSIASENGTTQAYLGNDVSLGEKKGQSVGNLTVQAVSTPTVSANSSASSGGILSGNGSVATATATPTVNADLGYAKGGGDQINVTGSISVLAQTLGQSTSDAEGQTIGGITVGISKANSQWTPTVNAVVESDSTDAASLQAGQDIDVQAYDNYNTDGTVASYITQAMANSSEGTLVGGIGSHATVNGNGSDSVSVTAGLGNNAVVSSGNNVNITADSANDLSSTASGDAYGVAVGGSADADAYLANQAVALTGSSVQVTAGNNVSILSNSNNTLTVNSTGGSGGLIAAGAAESTAELISNDTEATVGQNSTIDAGGILQVVAQNVFNVTSTTNQTDAGGVTDYETDSTAEVSKSLTMAALGSGVTINVHQLVLKAEDKTLKVSGYSDASAPFALAGNNTANTNVLLNSQALACIGSATQISATSSVAINALVDTAQTSSTALTGTTGVTGALYSTAGNTQNVFANVITATGSKITTTDLTVTATVPHDDPNGYVQDSETNAKTVTKTITEVVGTVCNVVGTVICAWGAFCNPQTVCTDITKTVSEVLDATTDATTPGSQNLSNTIDFNSDVTINGGSTPTLKVNSSGQVTQLSGISASDGNKPLSIGSYVTTGQLDVTSITAPAAGHILLSAAEGSTSGNSNVYFNTNVVGLISNDSANNLVLGNLDLFGGTNAPSITQSTAHDQNNWTYNLSTNVDGASLTVDNNNTATTGNDIDIQGTITNPIGTTTLHNSGGNIYAANKNDIINTRLIDLTADQGTIGTSSQSIFLQLPVTTNNSTTLPTGFQEAVGAGGVYLDVTPITEKSNTPLSFLVNNIRSSNGNVDLVVEDGLQLQEVIGARITKTDGTTVQGILLEDSFDPATAVNASTGVIDLGFDHGFTNDPIGQIVTYNNGGGTSIGGLRNGGFYYAHNVAEDPKAVQLGNTFDVATDVNNATGTINFGYDHGLQTGDQVVYDDEGGSSIAGLTPGQVYYVRYIDPTTIALAPTLAAATAGPVSFAAADVSNNSITFNSADGLTTGEAVTYQANGSPITGLTDGNVYYVIAVNSTTIQLAATAADAQAGTALTLDATGVTSLQGLLPGIIPLDATGVTGTQFLRINLDPSVSTGTHHSLYSGNYYLQINNTITAINQADVQTIQQGTLTTVLPADTTVDLENISAASGNVTIVGGSSQLATTNLVLSGTIASPAGTTRITTTSGSIQSGSSSHVIQAQNIDLNANSGAIGASGAVIQTNLTPGSGQLSASALDDIYITEIAGALRVGTVTSTTGSIVLSTLNDGALGEDLSLGSNSSVTASGGSITLLAGDDITLALNSVVSAESNVLIQSDFLGSNRLSQTDTIAIDGVISGNSAEIDGGSDNDIISLTHTVKGTPTLIKTGGGVNLVQIGSIAPGSGGSLDNIQGPLTIDGNGSDTLAVDDTGDTAPETGSLTPTIITGLGMGSSGITYSGLANLNINLGSGGNTFVIDSTAANTNTYLNSGAGADTVDVRATGGTTTVNTGGGSNANVVNVGSTAPTAGGIVDNIQGALTVNGNGFDTLNVDDTGSTVPKTGTLTPTTITGLGMGPNGITYGGLANLHVYLGSGGSAIPNSPVGNTFYINDIDPSTNTTVDGGSSNNDTVNAAFAHDFNGQLTLTAFEHGTVTVQGNFNGTLSDSAPGHLENVQIGGSLSDTGLLLAGSIDAMTVGQDLAGVVAVGGTLGSLAVGADVSGLVTETGTINQLTIGGSLTSTGNISAVNATPGLGNINTMTIDKDLAGVLTVSGNLGEGQIGGSLTSTGRLLAGSIGTLTIEQDLAGTATVSGTIGDLAIVNGSLTTSGIVTAGNINTMTIGQDLAGKVEVQGTLGSLAVGADVSGLVTETGTINLLTIGGSLTSTGIISAVNTTPTSGNIVTMTVGHDLAGTVVVSGALTTLKVGGDVSGSVTESGTINLLTIGGSLTNTGVVTAVNTTPDSGNINTMTVGQNLAGKVQVSGTLTTLQVGGDVSGSVTETGTINLLTIGGSLTPTGIITAVNATPDLGNINTMIVGKDLCGTVIVSGTLATLEVGGDICGSVTESGTINLLTIGGSLTSTGVINAGNINTATIGQDLAGTVNVSGTIGSLDIINGSMTPTGKITAGNLTSMVIGPNCLSVGQNMAGQIDVSSTLGSLQVAGGTPGSIVAGHIGTVAAYGGYGPVVLQITENGIQRRVEMGTAADPYPQPNPYALANTSTNPNYINIQYFYESGTLANPQLTARVTNNVSTAPNQFDLSLVVYNDTAKFNLARLDALGVSGIGNVDIEGDLLTSVTAQAANFFTMPSCTNGVDNTPAGVRLALDHLIGVGIRDFAPNGYIQAASIEGVAFGSYAEGYGCWSQTEIGATASAEEAEELLACGTQIVQANGTFRIPFADLPTQQVGFFFDSEEAPNSYHGPYYSGHFDNNNIAFTVQGVSTPNATDTGNIVTPSNVARGAVTALVTITPTVDRHGNPEDSVVQTIALRGDGASIQTEQYIAGGITSTGPLGDLILGSPQGITNVTAPSIFGNILSGGPITGTIQTTGLRTDPITGAVSSVSADFGRVYVAFADQDGHGSDNDGDNDRDDVPYLTSTVVQAQGGISGQIISRGNLLSVINANGGIDGVIAAQGNLGETVTNASGMSLRLGGILANGGVEGQIVSLGTIYGDIQINGGLSGRIAAKGGILGNTIINGGIRASGALVSGGVIGAASAGTALVVNGNLDGIIAALGTINFGKPPHQGYIFNDVGVNPNSPNAAAIDAIFAESSFDVSGLDLEGLDALLANLLALHVSNKGNLVD